MPDTTYIVLQREMEGSGDSVKDRWKATGTVSASSAEAAIRQSVSDEGTYVAVPARSWKPVAVRTETQTIIRLDTPKKELA